MFDIMRRKDKPALLIYTGEEPRTPAEALDVSIAKWQFIYDYYNDEHDVMLDDGGIGTCGLCLYYTVRCSRCPVTSVASWYCDGTPYIEYGMALLHNDRAAAKRAAAREVQFLKELAEKSREQQ